MRVPIGVVKEGERNPKHWILLVGVDASVGNLIAHHFADFSENLYFAGNYQNGNQTSFWKYNNLGTNQFSKIFSRSGSAEPEWAADITVSSFGNIFASLLSSSTYRYLSKRNSLLTEEWRKNIGPNHFAFNIGVDQSENIYFAAWDFTSSPAATQIVKLNSSGSVLWQQRLRNDSVLEGGAQAADSVFPGQRASIDSSSNVLLCLNAVANFQGSGSSRGVIVVKYNSSGTLQWQKRINASLTSGTFSSQRFFSVYNSGVDSSGNFFVLCNDGGTTDEPARATLVKLDSLGNLIWQKNIFGANNSSYNSVKIDNQSNVYISGSLGSSVFFIKYNSSGFIQWQRLVTISNSPSAALDGCRLDISPNGLLHVFATITPAINDKKYIAMSLPVDGSVMGSYSIGGARVTISTAALTDFDGTAVIANSSVPQISAASIIGGDPGGRTTADFAASQTIVKI